MTQIDAVYRGGVFLPLDPVDLAEEQRVRLRIERCDVESWQDWLRRVEQHKEEIIKRHGVLPDSTPDIAADRLRDV